jgi:hypothetical protein
MMVAISGSRLPALPSPTPANHGLLAVRTKLKGLFLCGIRGTFIQLPGIFSVCVLLTATPKPDQNYQATPSPYGGW